MKADTKGAIFVFYLICLAVIISSILNYIIEEVAK